MAKSEFATLKTGDEIPPLTKPPITREQLLDYGPASGDMNPIHRDDNFAKAAGYPSVFAHGMVSMGFLGELLAARFGANNIRRFRVRFGAITWPGDVITCKAKVVKSYEAEGERRLELDLATVDQKGEVKVTGSAVVAV